MYPARTPDGRRVWLWNTAMGEQLKRSGNCLLSTEGGGDSFSEAFKMNHPRIASLLR